MNGYTKKFVFAPDVKIFRTMVQFKDFRDTAVKNANADCRGFMYEPKIPKKLSRKIELCAQPRAINLTGGNPV